MTQLNSQSRQSEGGFTLVELAIVMIIIGLLIGGILKGQELINNARVSSTVAQIKAIESGISSFRDKYAALPGDMANATGRLPNCALAASVCIADASVGTLGDGVISSAGPASDPGLAQVNTNEGGKAFIHLGAAGMIGGVNPSALTATAITAGQNNPITPVGGAWVIGTSTGAAFTGVPFLTGMVAGVYVATSPNVAAAIPTTNAQVMTPVAAANIDRKVDDGQPNAGIVRAISNGTAAVGTTCSSANTAAGIYQEAVGGTVCGVVAKVQ